MALKFDNQEEIKTEQPKNNNMEHYFTTIASVVKKYGCTKQQAKDFVLGKIKEADLKKPTKSHQDKVQSKITKK